MNIPNRRRTSVTKTTLATAGVVAVLALATACSGTGNSGSTPDTSAPADRTPGAVLPVIDNPIANTSTDQNLTIGCGTRTDSHRWDRQRAGHHVSEVRWDQFKDDCEGACGLQCLRVLEKDLTCLTTALHAVAAHRVDRLGGEAKVGHHRNPGSRQGLDLRQHASSTLKLHRVRSGLLHEAG